MPEFLNKTFLDGGGRTRILLADDHRLLREGVRQLLSEQKDFEIVGEADNGEAAVRLARELSPHVVIMDARMPDLDGVESTRRIAADNARVKVICLSAYADHRFAANMLHAGAAGYVAKDDAFDELIVAIRSVIAGNIYVSPRLTRRVEET